ncbi:hypothetical protein ILUMI_15597 [Ignelater luminosus]|uniref:Uncharacterized protein n=1 Tax=Ignelater luminosus TaxID=2038154 RepID=A0A8K0CSQ6_IGNLU|nr:hypothetical protein ILUMI_15597 [Ignelater luminosus]
MVIARTLQKVKIRIEQIELEQVKQLKYLGSWITEDGKIGAQLDNSVQAPTKLYFSLNRQILNKKELYTRIKIRMSSVLYVPILTYGSEVWTLRKSWANGSSEKEIQGQTKTQVERRDPVLPATDRTGMERCD